MRNVNDFHQHGILADLRERTTKRTSNKFNKDDDLCFVDWLDAIPKLGCASSIYRTSNVQWVYQKRSEPTDRISIRVNTILFYTPVCGNSVAGVAKDSLDSLFIVKLPLK